MPIGHKGRFLLMVNAENKTEMEMTEHNIKLKLSYNLNKKKKQMARIVN